VSYEEEDTCQEEDTCEEEDTCHTSCSRGSRALTLEICFMFSFRDLFHVCFSCSALARSFNNSLLIEV